MRRLPCPEGHYHLFPEAHLHAEQRAKAPLVPLPFERNKEIDIARVARILDASPDLVERMCKAKLLRGYQIKGGPKSKANWRIERASVVEYCDRLRETYGFPERRRMRPGFLPSDDSLLPFQPSEAISVEDVMEHLDVSRMTVVKLFESGAIAAYKLLRNKKSHWRVHRPSFNDYVLRLRRSVEPKSQKSPSVA